MNKRKHVQLNEKSETVERIKNNLDIHKKMERKRRRKKLLIRFLMVILIGLMAYGVYLFDQSGQSRYQTIKVSGNQYYTQEEIIEASGVTEGSRMISNLPLFVRSRVKKLPLVENTSVNVYYIKGYLTIDIQEVKAVAYSKDESIKLYFANGEVRDANAQTFDMIAGLPLLHDFTPDSIKPKFLHELSVLPEETFLAISEIYSEPKELVDSAMKVVMNGEYLVYLSIETLPMLRQYATLLNRAEEYNKCIDMIEYGPNEESQTAVVRRCQ